MWSDFTQYTYFLLFSTDLSPLGSMPYLVSLDVSHNQLTTVLDFKPPLGLRVRCVVPENIHTPSKEGFFFGLNPSRLWKFQVRLLLSFKKIGL